MKKLLLIFIIIQAYLYGLDTKSTLNIYHEIFTSLLSQKPMIVYTKNKELSHVFKTSNKIVLSDNIKNATIILVTSQSDLIFIEKRLRNDISHSIIFATDYRLLKKSKYIIGAFYWKKGRSQLLFIKRRLYKHNIHLPDKYRGYMVDEL